MVTILTSSTPNDGSFIVPVSQFPVAGTGYQIEISETDAGGISGVRSEVFSVRDADKIILGPLPSECVVNQTCMINFTTYGAISNVKISYVITSGGSGAGTIKGSLSKASTPFAWIIPVGSDILPPCTLKIRVEDVSNAGTSVESRDSAISIMAMPLVSVLSPSESSQWVLESAATVL